MCSAFVFGSGSLTWLRRPRLASPTLTTEVETNHPHVWVFGLGTGLPDHLGRNLHSRQDAAPHSPPQRLSSFVARAASRSASRAMMRLRLS